MGALLHTRIIVNTPASRPAPANSPDGGNYA